MYLTPCVHQSTVTIHDLLKTHSPLDLKWLPCTVSTVRTTKQTHNSVFNVCITVSVNHREGFTLVSFEGGQGLIEIANTELRPVNTLP